VCGTLNRLLVADRDERLALDEAAGIVRGPERRARLSQQGQRRRVFERDLSRAIVALGGVPSTAVSYRARMGKAARKLRSLLSGPHEGDAYAACARAAVRTSDAYARALRSKLPSDVRFGVEREFSEIEWDRLELGRLRFGALPTASPAMNGDANDDAASAARVRESNDGRALGVWSDEGGAGD
jgi:uncharacterized protein (TIGR02284 family)